MSTRTEKDDALRERRLERRDELRRRALESVGDIRELAWDYQDAPEQIGRLVRERMAQGRLGTAAVERLHEQLVAHAGEAFAARAFAGAERGRRSLGGAHPGGLLAMIADGLRGEGEPLPHLDRLQAAFGRHDLRGVRAHVGGETAAAGRRVGARAFAFGEQVGFEDRPGLRQAAHEAAHVVQQRAGVAVSGDVGPIGDPYERQAGAVAEAVVAGRSAEALLGPVRGGVGRPVVQRDEEGDTEEEPYQLANARFAGDRTLQRIVDGSIAALSSRHDRRGGPVSKVQQALVDLGHDLPMHRVDGAFGPETEEAILRFRSQHAPGGEPLDSPAMQALDQVAPPPQQRTERFVDYGQLFADGRLDIVVGIGHWDDTTASRMVDGQQESTDIPMHELHSRRFREWLESNGFDLELLGMQSDEHWGKSQQFSYTDTSEQPQTRDVRIWVHLVTPGSGASQAFQRGLSQSEIAIYTGHARYGSGPDFDHRDSAVENFRIGIDRARQQAGRQTSVQEARRHGIMVDEENNLQQMVQSDDWDPDRYRVWFLDACTSLAYLDEIRSEAGGPQNIDVIGTRGIPSFVGDESGNGQMQRAMIFLEGLLQMRSMTQVVDQLENNQRGTTDPHRSRSGIWATDGFGDNPS